MTTNDLADLDGPTDREMAELLDEEALIEAGVNLVDAEILILRAYPNPTALDWHRMRRAEALVMRELIKFRARRETPAARLAA